VTPATVVRRRHSPRPVGCSGRGRLIRYGRFRAVRGDRNRDRSAADLDVAAAARSALADLKSLTAVPSVASSMSDYFRPGGDVGIENVRPFQAPPRPSHHSRAESMVISVYSAAANGRVTPQSRGRLYRRRVGP